MTYHAPHTVDQALALLAQGSVAAIAGGTDFFPTLRKGKEPDALLDLTKISTMNGISQTENGWRFGAVSTWSDIIKAELPPAFDALKAAAAEVGSIQIQNAGTIGGNLCNASPAADGVPPLLCLNASVEITGPLGIRLLPLGEFLQGVRKTALAPGEILTAVLVPHQLDAMISRFEKLGSRRYLVISITMTSVALVLNDGVIAEVRIAVGACSAVAQRQPALEASLVGQNAVDVSIVPDMLENLSPIEDVRGDASYRLIAVAEQCERAIQRLAVT